MYISDVFVDRCSLDPDVNAVLAGFDGHFSFTKLVKVASYLRDPNCLYVATNADSRLPLGKCIVLFTAYDFVAPILTAELMSVAIF